MKATDSDIAEQAREYIRYRRRRHWFRQLAQDAIKRCVEGETPCAFDDSVDEHCQHCREYLKYKPWERNAALLMRNALRRLERRCQEDPVA
jgi:hypothetical protein